jgi:hypothetical protein
MSILMAMTFMPPWHGMPGDRNGAAAVAVVPAAVSSSGMTVASQLRMPI